MDAEKLKSLQIDPRAKSRSSGALWMIFVAVLLVTGVSLYFAWPKKGDDVRLFGGKDGKSETKVASAQPGSVSSAGGVGSKPASAPTPSSGAGSGKVEGSVLTVSGYIVNRERIEISPRFLGLVKWIGVRKGDTVTNGQVLVRLDDAEQQARVTEAEGRVANTEAALEKAQLDYERMKRLIIDRIETKEREDETRLRVESTKAGLKEAKGALELARTYLDWTVIRSSIDGVVLEKLADAGELVTPQSFGGTRGPSTALVAVADPKDLQVEIDLNEQDLAKVFRNQRCKVSPEAYPDKVYGGYVAEIAPEANRQKGTLQVKVQIEAPDRFLTPELSAKVDFLGNDPKAREVVTEKR